MRVRARARFEAVCEGMRGVEKHRRLDKDRQSQSESKRAKSEGTKHTRYE